MNFEEKILQLRHTIEDSLLPLIDSDYVLWDLPYHDNIGDILIWQGELDFLHEVNYQCLDFASVDTCVFPPLARNTIILLHGGGNFGDIWRRHQEFRLKVCRNYPDNKIIVFPQTVFYENPAVLEADAQLMAQHRHLMICGRDETSYQLLKRHFKNEIVLVPDMAFCISQDYLLARRGRETKKTLFLKRKDKELGKSAFSVEGLPGEVEIRDWPSIEHSGFCQKVFGGLSCCRSLTEKYGALHFLKSLSGKFGNVYADRVLKPCLLKQGIRFVSHYRTIYTTRLHVLILSVLLQKEVSFLDNSYGKNSSFYETWLSDLPAVKRLEAVPGDNPLF